MVFKVPFNCHGQTWGTVTWPTTVSGKNREKPEGKKQIYCTFESKRLSTSGSKPLLLALKPHQTSLQPSGLLDSGKYMFATHLCLPANNTDGSVT